MASVSIPKNAAPNTETAPRLASGGFDWILFALVVVLSLWGVATVFSATQPHLNAAPTSAKLSDGTKQLGFIVVGLSALVALSFANFRWLVHLQGLIYAINLALLTLVLVLPRSLAPEINGAKSWIVLGPISLQMSEFSKFALLVCLAAFVARRQQKITQGKTVALSLLYLAPPLLLILKQPDFGTTMATLSIWFGLMFFGGARWQHLFLVAALGTIAFAGAYQAGVLKPHQVERLTSFMYPDENKKAGSYQLQQSLIAIGGGQITGQGYKRGMQNRSGYVPENQTDFIFTVVAEEFGFIGAATLIGCYLFLLLRTATLAFSVTNYFGVLLCGGFTALLAFHCIVNIGMTMRVMPITGVPLPYFSYGGSSFLAFSMCAGLLQSVARHRR